MPFYLPRQPWANFPTALFTVSERDKKVVAGEETELPTRSNCHQSLQVTLLSCSQGLGILGFKGYLNPKNPKS
jgi:hypothetical protein